VVEEKLIGDADLHPMQVVGMEGTFGFITLAAVLGIMYAVPSPGFLCNGAAHCDHFEDTYDAVRGVTRLRLPLQRGLASGTQPADEIVKCPLTSVHRATPA
jgi:hypothetical protein